MTRWIRIAAACLLIIAVSGIAVFALTPQGVATTPDSLQYLHAAGSVARGAGITTPDFDAVSESMERPMTVWPPLYPAALAPFVGAESASPAAEQGVRFLNWINLSILALAFAFAVGRIAGPLFGVAGALLLILQGPVLTVYAYAWSETLFLPLAFLSYLCARRYGEQHDKWALALAVLALAAACHTRYIGLVFALPLVLVAWAAGRVMREKILGSIAAGAGVLLLMTPLFLRNLSLSGAISGAARGKASGTVMENLQALGDVLGLHLFGISAWQTSAAAAVALVALAVFSKQRGDANSTTVAWADIAWPALWAACYLGALVALRSWKDFDPLDTRLISPALPFLVLSVIALALRLQLQRTAGRGWLLIPFALWGAFLVVHGALVYRSALEAWRTQHSYMFAADSRQKYLNFTANPAFAVINQVHAGIKQRYRDPLVVYDEPNPMLYRYLTGARVKALPAVLDQAAIDRINRQGEGVVLITSPRGAATIEQYYGKETGRLVLLPGFERYGVTAITLPLPLKAVAVR